MNGKIRLDSRKNELRVAGYPVCVFLHHKGKQKKINLGLYFQLEDWDLKTQLPKNDQRASLFIRKKQLLLDELVYEYKTTKVGNLDAAKNILLGQRENYSTVSFYGFYEVYLNELESAGKQGSYRIYKTAIDQLKKYRAKLDFSDIDYELLVGFRDWRLKLNNSKNTVHTYIRKYRAVYNEAVRRRLLENQLPFDGVFKGITVKSNRTKKRNITKGNIADLESAEGLTFADQRAVDLFLLLFYFGGQDLKDLYYLEKKNIANNRVYFMRGKLDGAGYQFDLRIPSKAQKIIEKYQVKGSYVFGWRKDFEGYKTFRDNFRRSLLRVQKILNIEVLPMGGNMGIKVARHTFATIGKQLFIEVDLLRELMGHERSDVDTIYKDKYPQEIRDAAHDKIIS